MEPYRVPFVFDRTQAPVYRLVNVSAEPVRAVTMTLMGSGIMLVAPPRSLQPAEHMEVTIRGSDLEVDAVLVIRWLRPAGDDYLWRVTF